VKGYLGEFPTDARSDWTARRWATYYIQAYGGIDGEHHKAWILDQVARILHGTPVIVTEARWENGEREIRFRTGPPSETYLTWVEGMKAGEYSYDEGIAP
jgi:hypothetical protein